VLARALGLVSLTAPLSAVLLAASAPAAFAAAAGSVSVPAGPVTSGTTVHLVASEPSGTVLNPRKNDGTFTVKREADSKQWNTSVASGKTVAGDYALSSSTVANGRWTASLVDSTGTTTKYFYVNFGPTATPAGVTATATNPAPGATTGTVDLSWTYAGTEPDLWGFRVVESAGQTTDDLSTATAACASGTCHVSKQYDNAPGSTKDYSFTVTPLRTSCVAPSGSSDARPDGCSVSNGPVPGTASTPATAQLVTPQPPPPPTPAPSGSATPTPGATPAPSAAATASPGTKTQAGGKPTKPGSQIIVPSLPPVAAARKNFALGYNNFSPSLGIPKLPPLPATTFAETVGGTDGGYQPVLPYKPQPAKSSPGGVLSAPLVGFASLDTVQLARMLAAALILLVAAAHVRLFLSGHRPD
jgi:hypothetical protein